MSSPPYLLFTALIDERGELSYDLGACPALTVYLYYPKLAAISSAMRCMGPEIIILDEIGPEECAALRSCARGGVPVVASVHAGSLSELRNDPAGAQLLDGSLFGIFAGLSRRGGVLRTTITGKDGKEL